MPILPVFGSVIDSCINIGPIEGFPAALPEVDCFPRFGPWNARVVRHNIFTVADDGKSLTTDCLRAHISFLPPLLNVCCIAKKLVPYRRQNSVDQHRGNWRRAMWTSKSSGRSEAKSRAPTSAAAGAALVAASYRCFLGRSGFHGRTPCRTPGLDRKRPARQRPEVLESHCSSEMSSPPAMLPSAHHV